PFPVIGLSIRYIPLLKETLTFPQSLGILGGKPGTSTYIAGVQDDRALYLDPHEVQLVKLYYFLSIYEHQFDRCCVFLPPVS
ncbi:Os03g0391000, partial [Oryza sativa Japonica Group]